MSFNAALAFFVSLVVPALFLVLLPLLSSPRFCGSLSGRLIIVAVTLIMAVIFLLAGIEEYTQL